MSKLQFVVFLKVFVFVHFLYGNDTVGFIIFENSRFIILLNRTITNLRDNHNITGASVYGA